MKFLKSARPLPKPQHWHCTVSVYDGLADDGRTFLHHTSVELVASDVEIAIARAKDLVSRPSSHVQSCRQCPNPTCLEGLTEY